MSSDQRLGSDPLDWIPSSQPRAVDQPGGQIDDVAHGRIDGQPGGQASGHPGEPPGAFPDERPNIWRAMRPKGDSREFKAALSEHLDRTQVADMLEVLANCVRAGYVQLGDGDKAASMTVGVGMDVEAAVSLKKDKARLQIELEWKNRKS